MFSTFGIWLFASTMGICLTKNLVAYFFVRLLSVFLFGNWNIILWILIFLAEYMPGGSLYDYLHKNHNILELPQLLKFAIDVSKGMEYLHQSNIIHRDLKTANLLMDNHNVRIYEYYWFDWLIAKQCKVNEMHNH